MACTCMQTNCREFCWWWLESWNTVPYCPYWVVKPTLAFLKLVDLGWKQAMTDFVSAPECICKSVFMPGLPSQSPCIWLPASAAWGWSLTYSCRFYLPDQHTDHQTALVEPKGLQLVSKPVVSHRRSKLRGAMKSEHKVGTSKVHASQVPGGFPSWCEETNGFPPKVSFLLWCHCT